MKMAAFDNGVLEPHTFFRDERLTFRRLCVDARVFCYMYESTNIAFGGPEALNIYVGLI